MQLKPTQKSCPSQLSAKGDVGPEMTRKPELSREPHGTQLERKPCRPVMGFHQTHHRVTKKTPEIPWRTFTFAC